MTSANSATGQELLLREDTPEAGRRASLPWLRSSLTAVPVGALVLVVGLGAYWNREPAPFDVSERAAALAGVSPEELAPGAHVVAATIGVAHTLLDKSGGYVSNDVAPPGSIIDNMPSWEYGVLTEVRDLVRALRNDFSRAQTQSPEDVDFAVADPQFHFNAYNWILPATEAEYAKGVERLESYLSRLHSSGPDRARFHARADNLNFYLATVEKRLGGYAQRLAESVHAWSDELAEGETVRRTPWLEVDNVFYETRGYAWALLHTLRAIERDFAPILESKNAVVPMQRIIDKLEQTQATIWSPVIMNNSGFGLMTNHSLVMASYLSRANAALIDLRMLLSEG